MHASHFPSLYQCHNNPPHEEQQQKRQRPPDHFNAEPLESTQGFHKPFVVCVSHLPASENDLHCVQNDAEACKKEESRWEEALEVYSKVGFEAVQMVAMEEYARVEV